MGALEWRWGWKRQALLLLGHREVALFSLALLAMGAAGGVFQTTFNNFLSDTFHLSAGQRSRLEFPRELPGFLCAVLAGSLAFLPEARMGMVALGGIGAGMLGLALWGDHYLWMLLFMVLWSSGEHLFMPVRSAVGMQLAEGKDSQATRLGQLGGVETIATILGCLFVWLAVDLFHWPYALLFAVGGSIACLGLWPLQRMRLHAERPPRANGWVVRRKYGLYYLLSVLFGARKQIFLTFGPWVLVKVFDQPPSTFARLWILTALIGIWFKPALGRWIDRWGERRVLMADALLLIGVCLGYGFARSLLPQPFALHLTLLCYLLDQLLFATGMARATYLSKIAVKEEDITPTLSLGVSLDHAVSMSIPWLGGWIWMRLGYPWVFAGAALLSLLNAIACSFVSPGKERG